MRIKLTYVTPLLATGAAALAIIAAPTAAAFPKICTANGGGTCQSPGNVEISNSPPAVNSYPYGTMPWLISGH